MAVSPARLSAALHETGHILGIKLGSGFGLYRRRLGVNSLQIARPPGLYTHPTSIPDCHQACCHSSRSRGGDRALTGHANLIGIASHQPVPIDSGGGGMQGFRLFLAVGAATILLCVRSASSAQSTQGAAQGNTACEAITPNSAGQVAKPPIVQRALATSKSSRPKPRRARPVKRTSSRPKSVSQRTRQVGKQAHTRSVTRLKNNKARAKQRFKRTPVPARRKANITRKKPPLVRVNKPRRAPVRKASTTRSPATPQRKKPKATNK